MAASRRLLGPADPEFPPKLGDLGAKSLNLFPEALARIQRRAADRREHALGFVVFGHAVDEPRHLSLMLGENRDEGDDHADAKTDDDAHHGIPIHAAIVNQRAAGRGPLVSITVPDGVRVGIEEREAAWLSPFAALAQRSSGRPRDEAPDPVRTDFQRDRDRILHSKAFRRLKHKTQVFLDPVGDHYRTRMTHSLEVAQIARTIGRALRLNEDLIEAIALAHDVGHTPFGHAGEEALDAALRESDPAARFRHYEQSLRVVDVLEPLNLTHETRQGIGGHSKGRRDLSSFDGEPTSTLEAAVVRISDRIAYLNHDLDDALRSGIVSSVPNEFEALGARHSQRIGRMVEDVIAQSQDRPAIGLSPDLLDRLNRLKEWLFENVYLEYPRLYPEQDKARRVVRELFLHYAEPGHLPADFEGVQGAVDYVAGMTDRFAIEDFARLRIPNGFRPEAI